jgi:hypothetical protein
MTRDAPVHANWWSLRPHSTRVATGVLKIINSILIINIIFMLIITNDVRFQK